MRKLIVTYLLMIISLVVVSQDRADEKVKRLFIEPDIGLSLGTNSFYFGTNPRIGYLITNELSTGTGPSYEYISRNNAPLNYYGWKTYMRYMISSSFYGEVEHQYLYFQYYDNTSKKARKNYNSILIGGGYMLSPWERSGIFTGLFYNILYDPLENPQPYDDSPIVIKTGVFYRIFIY